MQLAVTDLFVVGLGFDLVGGWLLARGLITSPALIIAQGSSYWGTNYAANLAAAEDRIDARFGIGSLLLGFALQALGYVLDLAKDDGAVSSWCRAWTAIALLATVVVVVFLTWRVTRRRRLRVAWTPGWC